MLPEFYANAAVAGEERGRKGGRKGRGVRRHDKGLRFLQLTSCTAGV